jgi:hypothetical protein
MFEYYESEPLPDNVNIKYGQPDHHMAYFRKRILLNDNQTDYGVEAVFFSINDHEGVKLYRCVKDGKRARDCQEEAHGFGLGPKVRSALLEFIFPFGADKEFRQIRRFPLGKAYGYYTQLADMERMTNGQDYEDAIEELRTNCMESLSFSCCDLHSRNVGWIDDRLVMIDFGFATTGEPTQRPRGHFSIKGTDSDPSKPLKSIHIEEIEPGHTASVLARSIRPRIITDAQGKHHRVTPQLDSFHKGKLGLPFKVHMDVAKKTSTPRLYHYNSDGILVRNT